MRSRRSALRLAPLILAAGLLASPLTARSSFAGYTTCETDPTVLLSNGTTLTLWADVGTDPSQLTGVTYVLHVPDGVYADAVTYDQYAPLESLQVIDDLNGNRYRSETTVQTISDTADVTAFASNSKKNVTKKVNGKSGQTLKIDFNSSGF